MNSLIIKLFLAGLAALFTTGIIVVKRYYPSYKDDNALEEAVENAMEEESGMDIDLTPSSKEQNDIDK